ncbi:MAG TPA: ABC transporter substrate-binding protein [Syntrophorhabdales bacterium]|nr:ABC transporter substrate-binding protein [Syntrophorhabdales bacterium]
MKRRVPCMFFVTVLAVIFFATGAQAAEKEIRIGFITDLTSMLSINGISMRQAAILAMEEVGYKVAGKPAKLLVEDEASDPAIAMDKARRLVETDKIALLLGPFHGGCSSAVAEYVNRTRTPNLSCSYSVPDEAQAKAHWTWAPFGTNNQIGYAGGVYAAEASGYRTATTMSIDFAAGRAFVEGFMAAFSERGGKAVQDQWIPMGTKDIAPYITGLKQADVLVPWFAGVTVTAGVRQIREFKVNMPIVFPQCQFPAFPKQLAEIGDAGVGMVSPEMYVWTIDTPKNKKFVEAYQKRWGELPTSNSGSTYMTMQLVFEAFKKTGGDTSPTALAKALDTANVEGFVGPIRFADGRVGIGNYVIHKVVKVGNDYRTEVLTKYTIKTTKVGNKLVHSVVKQ